MRANNIVITGVTGQDGSYMVDYLMENTQFNIIGVIRRSSNTDFSNVKSHLGNPRFTIATADLSDSQSIDGLVQKYKPSYFFNFAAQSFVGSSWQLPEQTFDVNAMGLIRICESVKKHQPDCVIYSAGSSEEFGDVFYSPQDENHPLRPRSPYGVSKCAARHISKVWRESYGLKISHCTLFNHESPRRGSEFVTQKIAKGVADISFKVARNQEFTCLSLGTLDVVRDWSHSKDFIRGIWMIVNMPTIKEYVLASGQAHSVRDFVNKSFGVVGIKGEWVGSGLNEEYVHEDKTLVNINKEFYRPAEVEFLLGDASLAQKEVGWKPLISFDSLVQEMVQNQCLALTKQQ